MGIAEVIPGISGGTIAFLLGIYEPFINSIKSINLHFFKLLFSFKLKEAFNVVAWKFLIVLVAGMGTAIVCLSHFISWMIEQHPSIIFSFFFGLILATGPIIARIVEKWTPLRIVVLIGVAIATFFFVTLVPMNTPNSVIFIFLCGAIAISAMILPGISGSFILLLLGKYQYILNSVNERELVTILIFLCGIAVGVLTFVRVLSWLFAKFHDMTLCVLTGFVLGSLNKIWPWKKTISTMMGRHGELIPVEQINQWPPSLNGYTIGAVCTMILGFGLALMLNQSDKSTFRKINNA